MIEKGPYNLTMIVRKEENFSNLFPGTGQKLPINGNLLMIFITWSDVNRKIIGCIIS